ncbi:uncharacterized protein LOC131945952 [Physella acuta]|uniref:uncharacterized protein LOC131945952 n=1 Tax=Physella acuta TaxID=109671 RepID=UPI0027DC3536|nr:uncharacterized protein LOC131945952 [Physella acuta]
MFGLVLISLTVGLSSAIVCLPSFCDNIVQPVLDCKGSVIEHSGFCGCYKMCAKVEGESCSLALPLLGVPSTDVCDQGLDCVPSATDGVAQSFTCVRKAKRASTVTHCVTECQRKSLMCSISMAIYEGQWFANCDQEGNFLPEQCDNTNHCFCVDRLTGAIQDGTKVLGSANCSGLDIL